MVSMDRRPEKTRRIVYEQNGLYDQVYTVYLENYAHVVRCIYIVHCTMYIVHYTSYMQDIWYKLHILPALH